MKLKSQMFDKNIASKQKGKEVPKSLKEDLEDEKPPVSPFVMGLLLFLVVGSALFQILQQSRSGSMVE